MRCYDCGETCTRHSGKLQLENHSIGWFEIDSPEYYKCDKCGKLLFPEETLEIIDAFKKEKLNRILEELPVKDFISGQEAADTLGISKQAFHKHRRIRNGFIYSIKKWGKRVYHKKSVELFKSKGDGRFSLYDMEFNESRESAAKEHYTIVYINAKPDEISYRPTLMPEEGASLKKMRYNNILLTERTPAYNRG
ncbi:MAG: hypothetical protein GXP53_06490 [Deltaproteobacteria bacterium]|nr:hypothetical protein [Deltaproteobacteria bacterium]